MSTHHPTQNPLDPTTFDALLSAWNHHQDLRTAGGGIAELSASRASLDRLRLAVRH